MATIVAAGGTALAGLIAGMPARADPPAARARPIALDSARVPVQAWRSRIRSALLVPDPLPPLEAETHGGFEVEPGVVAERVTYGTQFGKRVTAIVYRPAAPHGKAPGLVVVNGHGGDKFTWYAFYAGVLYARAGAVVLTFDPIGEGERNLQRRSGTRAHDRQVEPEEMARRLGGLLLTDVLQAVSYLEERPEVDPRRIGLMGYSLGSFLVALAGAADSRPRACVLVGGGNLDGPGGYWDSSTKRMCQSTPYRSLAFLGDRPAALYALHAERGPALVVNGSADTVVAMPETGPAFFNDLQARVARLRGRDDGIFEFAFVPAASHRPFFVTRPVALWLERQLDFPSWTEESIKTLGETHIGPWAEEHRVPLDRLYATEDREGGVRALATGIPALPRERLFALDPDDWERLRDRLTYERWVEAAKAHLGQAP